MHCSERPRRPHSHARVCLEDRPGATISFTSHDAQPKTGTTPAPPKATVNDDHPTSTGVLKRYKPGIDRRNADRSRRPRPLYYVPCLDDSGHI
jgi:hypothetical protein